MTIETQQPAELPAAQPPATVQTDQWDGARKSVATLEREETQEAVDILYGADTPAEPEPPVEIAPADATRGLPAPSDPEEVDPEEAAYVEAERTVQIKSLVQENANRWMGDVARTAAELGFKPEEALTVIRSGRGPHLLDFLEQRAKAMADQLVQTDKGRGAAALGDVRQRFEGLRKTLSVIAAGANHVTSRDQELANRSVARKKARELAKLPADFDFKANVDWMKAQGYTEADIAAIDTAKKAKFIDAARRGSLQQSGTPQPKRKIVIPKVAKRPRPAAPAPEQPSNFNELRHRLTGSDAVVDLYGRTPRKRATAPGTNAADGWDDPVTILYGRNNR